MATARLRSSFIYLANAVNDLSGNWTVLALVLAPLVLGASLCLLPDALNIQHRVAHSFESGDEHSDNVMLHRTVLQQVQTPYHPPTNPAPSADPYPEWLIRSLHMILLLILLMVFLVVLCQLVRTYSNTRAPTPMAEAVEIYKLVLRTAPAYLWVSFLQILVVGAVCVICAIPLMLLHIVFFGNIAIDPYIKAPLLVPGLLIVIVLHFSKVALVFDGIHSWSALLHSRELERGRFVKVAIRIVVFLAMLSGYNSWASGAFFIASVLLGPVGAMTGYIWSLVFVLDLLSVAVFYLTLAFFVAASVRLYKDLSAMRQEQATGSPPKMSPSTPAPMPGIAAGS